jgi:small GTP-binding protein
MLGAFAVGKTSLVRRYVKNIFSDKYQTTIGVKVDKKTVVIGEESVELILWDLAGKDGLSEMRTSYLRGASGYLLVVDKTRSNTLDIAIDMNRMAQDVLGSVPFLVLLNKCDLEGKWDIDEAAISSLKQDGWQIIETSAKTGMGVDEAFKTLTVDLLK